MGELKPGWTRVRFGDVVRLSKERCADPAAAGIERYIGLEHLEPGDLRVRSWGNVADGTTFTNRVRPGQVLFGKRRAYQRKVAVAEFDAVCSGDIYVLESADPKRLMPELLPFLCQTDAFYEHAVGTSAGSLSPRTNWSSLAGYEFALPPLVEQRRVVLALDRARRLVELSRERSSAAWMTVDSALMHWQQRATSRRPLQELCRVPVTYGIVKAGLHTEHGVPYIRVADITAGVRLSQDGMLRTSEDISREYGRTVLSPGDSVVAVKASRGVVGKVRMIPEYLAGANISRDVARVSPAESLDRAFIHWMLRTPAFMSGVQARETGWKGDSLREITIAALRTVPVPWLPESLHRFVAQQMRTIEDAALASDRRLAESIALCSAVVETVTAGAG